MSSQSERLWSPYVGDETLQLLRSKGFTVTNGEPDESGKKILYETSRILGSCKNSGFAKGFDTGIVIGYVQSGKTLSFTTLAALARDNNYKIVIVIAGTTVNLVNQSTMRLRDDLRLDARSDRKWLLLQNPGKNSDRQSISNLLLQWEDATFPDDRCKTLIITVMKNGSHLKKLHKLLSGFNLTNVPTLIIDDEGDQASLNTKARKAAREGIDFKDITENNVSTIYKRITSLRAVFPIHTFLQYTATPQANLFINILDRLSPDFIKLLTPGQAYTGGVRYFQERPNIIVEIPLSDIPNPHHDVYEAPESLRRALRIFYLGVVMGDLKQEPRNRTMLVHPSRLQEDHSIYFNWVNFIRDSWFRLLSGNDEDEKKELMAEFFDAYEDLRHTVNAVDLLEFQDVSNEKLIHAIQYTPIIEVNARSGATPQINWKDTYSCILIGGQSMDRGFTIEGLTVTYMPRNLGVGNVDTILQRARFFGYRRDYIGFCRVFLPQVTIDAFNAIIEHEQDVRQRLLEFDLESKHLNDWEREAVLDQMLSLTRSNVLYDAIDRDRFGNDWFSINAPHDTEIYIEKNKQVLTEFLKERKEAFSPDAGHEKRTIMQRHLTARFSINETLDILNRLKFTRNTDSATYSSLRGILKNYSITKPDEECLFYLMSAQSIDVWHDRERALSPKDEIPTIHQGKNSKGGILIYPGDSEIKQNDMLTIQVHMMTFKGTNYKNVPTLAIWVPEHIGKDVVRQIDNNSRNAVNL